MKNDLAFSLELISESPINQKKYIDNLFDSSDYDNIEEILLIFDDSIYQKESYTPNIGKELDNLDLILNEIDENELYTYNDLYNPVWDKARCKAKEILFLMNFEQVR